MPEFKANAVRLVKEEGLKIGDVANDLGIGTSTLKMWLSKHQKGQLTKTEKQTEKEEELKKLRKENRILRQERDILKKAMGIFSSMSKTNCDKKLLQRAVLQRKDHSYSGMNLRS